MFTDDPIQQRQATLSKMEAKDGQVTFVPKRTNVTEADRISKLRKYKDTQNNKFNSCGTGIYRRLRRDFFKTCKSQGILLDLLFNYQNQDGVGLVTKDRYGPHDFKVLKNANSRKPTVPELPANPFGLSLEQCEQEAEDILDAMIFPGPMAVQLNKVKERDQPILFVFAFYDKMFFSHPKMKKGDLRMTFLAMKFIDDTDVSDKYTVMTQAKDDWRRFTRLSS